MALSAERRRLNGEIRVRSTKILFVASHRTDVNKHFEDAVYYLGRAAEHVREGVREELAPVERRVRKLAGRERDPAPSRLQRLQTELRTVEKRAEGTRKKAVYGARNKLQQYRDEPAATE